MMFFYKASGREGDLFLLWDGRDHVEHTTCSKAIRDKLLSQTN